MGAYITFKMKGLAEILLRFNALPRFMDDAAIDGIREVAYDLRDDMKAHVPVYHGTDVEDYPPGLLKNSIEAYISRARRVAWVGPAAKERYPNKHISRAYNVSRNWAHKAKKSRVGKAVTRGGMMLLTIASWLERGTRKMQARPWFRPAVTKAENTAKVRIEKHLKDAWHW